eukprot:scaffold403652_cov18-Prasinocladus_malaysianus.AAC.1
MGARLTRSQYFPGINLQNWYDDTSELDNSSKILANGDANRDNGQHITIFLPPIFFVLGIAYCWIA